MFNTAMTDNREQFKAWAEPADAVILMYTDVGPFEVDYMDIVGKETRQCILVCNRYAVCTDMFLKLCRGASHTKEMEKAARERRWRFREVHNKSDMKSVVTSVIQWVRLVRSWQGS